MTEALEPVEPAEVSRSQRAITALARAITELLRLGGGVLAVNELALRPELRSSALLVIALMIAGAQGLDSILDRFRQR